VLATAACDRDSQGELDAVCTQFCECTAAPLPATQQQCVATCSEEPQVFGDGTCQDCILQFSQTCSMVESKCVSLCEEPPISGGGDDSI
jgi:hypothetical protein